MTQYEDETIFEAPLAHEGESWEGMPELGVFEAWPEAGWSGESSGEFLGETGAGTHESSGWAPEAGYETGWETGYESGFPEAGWEASYETGYESGYPETGWETGYESGYPETGWEAGYESGYPEAGWETGYETSYESGIGEADPFLGNLVSGALSALGLGEEELAAEYSGEYSGESDQFLGGVFNALRNVVKRVVPQAKQLLPGALGALSKLIPGGGLLAGALGQVLPGLLREGESELAHLEAQMLGGGAQSLGEVGRDERSHEASLTEILANEAVVAESEDEAASLLATTLPITITIMGGRRALRPVLPAYAQAQRRLVLALRQDPQRRQLLRAIPSIDRRAVWLMRRWQRMGRPVTGQVAVNALAAATRDVLSRPERLQHILMRNGAIRLRTAPMRSPRVDVYRPGYRSAFRPPVATFQQPMGYRPPVAPPRPAAGPAYRSRGPGARGY